MSDRCQRDVTAHQKSPHRASDPARPLSGVGKFSTACSTGDTTIRMTRSRRVALVDIRKTDVSLLRSLRGLCADFRAGEPMRLTIRLADLVVTEWVLGCGSQLLTRAHGLTTHLVLSLLHARSPALGPTSFPPRLHLLRHHTSSFPDSPRCTPPATSRSSLPSHLRAHHPRRTLLRGR